MLLAFLSMAKAKSRRGKRRYVLVAQGDSEIALATLAAQTAITAAFQANADRPIFVISADGIWTVKDLTVADGPIVVGWCHSDYTVTEIKEYLEGNTGFTRASMTEREIQTRKIRVAGIISSNEGTGTDAVLNDGKPIRTKLGWSQPAGTTINMFAYNKGTDLTTGAELQVTGKVYFKNN